MSAITLVILVALSALAVVWAGVAGRRRTAKAEQPAAAASPRAVAADEHSAKRPALFRTYVWTVIWIAISLLLTAAQFGFMVTGCVIFGLVIWLIYSLAKLPSQPQRLRPFLVKSACWAVTLAIMIFYQSGTNNEARAQADQVVALISAYKATHGAYPGDLDALGSANQALVQNAHVHYGFYQDKPFLFYPSRTRLFVTFNYDFDSKQWHEQGD